MISWKIYTEDKNSDWIQNATKEELPYASVGFYFGTGLWKGKREHSLMIEYIGIGLDEDTINNLARRIKEHNQQEAVLVTATEILDYKLI